MTKNHLNKKLNIQKNILKILNQKPAVPIDCFQEVKNYAINRSIKNLIENGYIEKINSDHKIYLKITDKGKNKFNSLKLEADDSLVSVNWDGFWRIIILAIPENRKKEREALRYLLKKANFICLKNTIWISPLPYENLFMNIKKDLNLKNELMIIVTNQLDPETQFSFLSAFKKN